VSELSDRLRKVMRNSDKKSMPAGVPIAVLTFSNSSAYNVGHIDGARFENARLSPLFAELLKCVEALEYLDNKTQPLIAKTLASLESKVKEMEK